MKMKQQRTDDGLEWLRAIRRKIAAECDYDPRKLGDRYRRLEVELRAQEQEKALALHDKRK